MEYPAVSVRPEFYDDDEAPSVVSGKQRGVARNLIFVVLQELRERSILERLLRCLQDSDLEEYYEIYVLPQGTDLPDCLDFCNCTAKILKEPIFKDKMVTLHGKGSISGTRCSKCFPRFAWVNSANEHPRVGA